MWKCVLKLLSTYLEKKVRKDKLLKKSKIIKYKIKSKNNTSYSFIITLNVQNSKIEGRDMNIVEQILINIMCGLIVNYIFRLIDNK